MSPLQLVRVRALSRVCGHFRAISPLVSHRHQHARTHLSPVLRQSTLARLDRKAPRYGVGKYNDFNTFYYQVRDACLVGVVGLWQVGDVSGSLPPSLRLSAHAPIGHTHGRRRRQHRVGRRVRRCWLWTAPRLPSTPAARLGRRPRSTSRLIARSAPSGSSRQVGRGKEVGRGGGEGVGVRCRIGVLGE